MQTTLEIDSFEDFLSDFQESDTFNRMLENEADTDAHSEGMFGLSHRQMINGWVEYLAEEIGHLLTENKAAELMGEIKETIKWHENNKSIDEII